MRGKKEQPQEISPDFKLMQEKRAFLIKSIQEKKRSGQSLTLEEKQLADELLEQERIDDQPRFGRY